MFMSVYPLECFLCVSMFQGCFRSIPGVFQKAFKGVFSFIFSKNVINKLTTMSKNPAFSQKILEDWLTLPERQELFAGLISGLGIFSRTDFSVGTVSSSPSF